MLIAVFSDTHRQTTQMLKFLDNHSEIDAVFHCGDVAEDIDSIKMCFPHLSVFGVRGNNDFFTDYPKEIIITLDGMKFFITHGHYYSVKSGDSVLKSVCRSKGCDVCVYGHTHTPSNYKDGTISVLNPGSLKYKGTYALINTKTKEINLNDQY